MTTYFHIAGPNYRIGDDLLCWDELDAAGEAPEWKWDGEPFDTDVVCLFETREDAEQAIADGLFPADVTLLRVEVPADATVTRVSEGYPAIFNRIPAEWISVA